MHALLTSRIKGIIVVWSLPLITSILFYTNSKGSGVTVQIDILILNLLAFRCNKN